jgi:hypothetical protein
LFEIDGFIEAPCFMSPNWAPQDLCRHCLGFLA